MTGNSSVFVVALTFLIACDSGFELRCGPETTREGDACVPVERNASVPVSGDLLIVREWPDYVGAQLVPNSASCLRATLLDEVGNLTHLVLDESSFRIRVQNPTVAVPAPWDDCRTSSDGVRPGGGPGLIGVSPGTTRAILTFEREGVETSGVIGIEVLPYTLELTPLLQTRLPEGTDELITGAARATNGDEEISWRVGTGPFVPPSLMHFDFTNPSVAEVVRNSEQPHFGWGYLLRGHNAGTTTLTIRHGLDGQEQALAPIELTVTDTGQLVDLSGIDYELVEDGSSPTGYCYETTLFGRFQREGEPDYTAAITREVAWQPIDDGLVRVAEAPPVFFPTGSGESDIRGCIDGLCTIGTIAKFADGELVHIDTNLDTVSGTAGPLFSGYQTVCLPIRVDAQLADGSTLEITGSRLMDYSTDLGWDGGFLFTPRYNDDNELVFDGAGNLCFDLASDIVCTPVTSVDIPVRVQYNATVPGTSMLSMVTVFTASIAGIAIPSSCS